ncbi:hypothetical protein SAMN04487897_14614 [Paenibacillus sp. yr247]|uniref:hypothetical protein n=1 Tax=Paenibacillus sp. yr247 TaxID=1761880 RepID=UPI000889EE45|nr:hypothetical protein [Paenibacillus sp. yr247]SDP20104.1 hypothetical protein SAMN04487897_14614 [Paenibacillus sp. yr247]
MSDQKLDILLEESLSICHEALDQLIAMTERIATADQNEWIFGDIPEECILIHDWIKDCKTLGFIPAAYVKTFSGGAADWDIPISINRIMLEGEWDIILNIGHIVPHEVFIPFA